MFKITFVFLLLSMPAFATNVVIVKSATAARISCNDYRDLLGDYRDVQAAAKKKSEKSCQDIGGKIVKTTCDTSMVWGFAENWTSAAACASICEL